MLRERTQAQDTFEPFVVNYTVHCCSSCFCVHVFLRVRPHVAQSFFNADAPQDESLVCRQDIKNSETATCQTHVAVYEFPCDLVLLCPAGFLFLHSERTWRTVDLDLGSLI